MAAGIKKVLIPEENKKELAELDKNILKSLKVICINDARSILEYTLVKPIVPLSFSESQSIKTVKTSISSENIDEPTAH